MLGNLDQIGERDTWNGALTLMWRDLWNSVGHDVCNHSPDRSLIALATIALEVAG
jgi:hypothetical protein